MPDTTPADPAPREGDEFADLEAAARAARPRGDSYCGQKGTPGHCQVAQIWDADGNAFAGIEPTEDEAVATADAAFIAAANPARVLALLAELRRQAARIGELTRERDDASFVADEASKEGRTFMAERDAARAEVARLTTANATERECRLANEAELIRADGIIGNLRREVERLTAGRAPEDDAEPVTEEWWDGMGAKRIWPANTNRGLRIGSLAVAANADSLVLWDDPEGKCIGIRICINPNRGHVRRLLAALGLTPTP